jgi:hypothetical protein
MANKPDVTMRNKRDKTYLLTAVAIKLDKNAIKMERGKDVKNKNLSTEIQRMWKLKCFFIRVITGATGSN